MKKTPHPYADLLDLPYPDPNRTPDRELLRKYPRTPIAERAKIFNPYAAVTSHKKAVAAAQKLYRKRTELSEECKKELDATLCRLIDAYKSGERPLLIITYFTPAEGVTADYLEEGIPDNDKSDLLGTYRTVIGKLQKLREDDPEEPYCILECDDDEMRIPLREVYSITADNNEKDGFSTVSESKVPSRLQAGYEAREIIVQQSTLKK